ncbi:MAG: TadG family pilus assembly protein [Alphaproteobacteria bacterium]
MFPHPDTQADRHETVNRLRQFTSRLKAHLMGGVARFLPKPLRLALENDTGAIAIMMAGVVSFAAATSVVAIDVSNLYAKQRALQNAADAAAMAVALDLGRAEEIALASLDANGYAPAILAALVDGRYTPDPDLTPAQRFNPATAGENAVQIELQETVDLYFLRAFTGADTQTVRVASIAANVDTGGFAVGTGVLTTEEGLASDVLNALGGSSVSLDVVSWQGLANGRVNVPLFMDSLATELGIAVGTYEDILAVNATVGQIISAAIAVFNHPDLLPLNAENAAALAALETLDADAAFAGQSLPLNELLGFDVMGRETIGTARPDTVLDPALAPLDLVMEALKVSRSGEIIGLGAAVNLPGLADVDLELAVGEPPNGPSGTPLPRIAVGPIGTSIHTAPVRLRLEVELLNLVSTAVGSLGVTVPLYVEAAGGDATLASVNCGTEPGTDGTMGINAEANAAGVYIGDVGDAAMLNFFTPVNPGPARIVDALLVTIDAEAEAEVLGSGLQGLTFTAAQIEAGDIQRIGAEETVGTLMTNLSNDMTLDVNLLGLPVPLGPIVTAVSGAISPALTALDPLLSGTFETLGVRPGYMDVAALGMRCGAPVLVQ